MKAWLVRANDSYLWFQNQHDAEGYANTLIADIAVMDDAILTIHRYWTKGDLWLDTASILNGHCHVTEYLRWERQHGETTHYSKAQRVCNVKPFVGNHPTTVHAQAVNDAVSDPSVLEIIARCKNHTEWLLFTTSHLSVPKRLATYIYFYLKGKRLDNP